MSTVAPELSVVAPLHNEEDNVRPLYEAIRDALEPLGRPFEILLVNDGSTDRTPQLLDELAAADPRLRPIHLDGNFGEAAGLCAGFHCARGQFILTLDGDLQNDPADLPRLLELLETGGYRAVSGWRKQRQEDMATRVLPSKIANRMIAAVTGVPSRDNGCGLKAYRADVVKGVYLPHGLHRFMPAVFGVTAGQFGQVEVKDRRRNAGKSHYGLSRFFAVVRDVLLIPYLLRSEPRNAQISMITLLAIGLAAVVGGMIITVLRHSTTGLLLVGAGVLVALYANCVRANLERWMTAQRDRTFRIRGEQTAHSPSERATTPGEVGA